MLDGLHRLKCRAKPHPAEIGKTEAKCNRIVVPRSEGQWETQETKKAFPIFIRKAI